MWWRSLMLTTSQEVREPPKKEALMLAEDSRDV